MSVTTTRPRSLIFREIVPFLSMFAALLLATTLIDFLLHFFELIWIGRFLGIPGTIFILLSFGYSLRKRKYLNYGNPRKWMHWHIAMTWSGALMILVHAGVHAYSLLPWLALGAMLINVISGMIGMYLLGRSRRVLSDKRDYYLQQGLADDAVDRKLFWDATTFDLMKKWREIHLPITLIFAGLSLAHILSIFVFWQWR